MVTVDSWLRNLNEIVRWWIRLQMKRQFSSDRSRQAIGLREKCDGNCGFLALESLVSAEADCCQNLYSFSSTDRRGEGGQRKYYNREASSTFCVVKIFFWPVLSFKGNYDQNDLDVKSSIIFFWRTLWLFFDSLPDALYNLHVPYGNGLLVYSISCLRPSGTNPSVESPPSPHSQI